MLVIKLLFLLVSIVSVASGAVFFTMGCRRMKNVLTGGNCRRVQGSVACFREYNDYLGQGRAHYRDYSENADGRRAVVTLHLDGEGRTEVMSAFIVELAQSDVGAELGFCYKGGKDPVVLLDRPEVVGQYNRQQGRACACCLLAALPLLCLGLGLLLLAALPL